MVLFGFLLAAMYRKSHVHTVGEMLERLYSRRTRIVTSLCFVVAFVILSCIQLQAIGSVASQASIQPVFAALFFSLFFILLLTAVSRGRALGPARKGSAG
jgi:Na+/proline symporter